MKCNFNGGLTLLTLRHIEMTKLEEMILRRCGGHVVNYQATQAEEDLATATLVARGYIKIYGDQSHMTAIGDEYLERLEIYGSKYGD